MKRLLITNTGKDIIRHSVEFVVNKSPVDRLSTMVILPNYYLLENCRKVLAEVVGSFDYSRIKTFDNLAEDCLDLDKYYLENEEGKYIVRRILEDLEGEYNVETDSEILKYIHTLKSRNISPEELEDLLPENLIYIVKVYERYEEYLKENSLDDYQGMYSHATDCLSNYKGLSIFINGFIEFRREEMELIKALSIHNDITVVYPFSTKRTSIKEHKLIRDLREVGFEVDVGPHFINKYDRANFEFMASGEEKYDLPVNVVSADSIQREVKSVLELIKKDLETMDYEDIAVVAPENYEPLLKIYGREKNIPIISMGQNKICDIPVVREFITLLEFIENGEKHKLISVLESKYITVGTVQPEYIQELRGLDFSSLENEYDVSTGLVEIFDSLAQLKSLSIKTGIEGIKSYFDSLDLREKSLDMYKYTGDSLWIYDFINGVIHIEDALDSVTVTAKKINMTGREELGFLIDYLENSTYYEEVTREAIKIFRDINAVGVIPKSKYVLGLSGDLPSIKRRSNLYSDMYKELSDLLDMSTYEEDMDNEILKFVQSLSATESLYLSYTYKEDQNYRSVFLDRYLDRILDSSVTYLECEDLLSGRDERIIDIHSGGKRLNNISEEELASLNFVTETSSLRKSGDPKYWGDIGEGRDFKSYSANMLDRFNKCGFSFLCKYILELEGIDTDFVDEYFIDKGNFYHIVLKDYFTKYQDLGITSEEEISSRLSDLVDKHKEEYEFDHIEYEIFTKFLLEYLLEEQKNEDSLNRGFGPYKLESRWYRKIDDINIYGIIDRVDRDREGQYIVYDYKSATSPTLKDVTTLKELQLPVYSFLVNESVGAAYGIIERPGISIPYIREDLTSKGIRNKWDQEELDIFFQETVSKIREVIKDSKSGKYLVDPIDEKICWYCDYKDICRREEL